MSTIEIREKRKDQLGKYPERLLNRRLGDLLQAVRKSGPWEPWPSSTDPDQLELPLDDGDIDIITEIQADIERDKARR